MEPHDLLKKPYARIVLPETDGSFTAEIVEFPGCVATGETATDALANVEEVAIDWISATLEQGQDIPEPLDHANYSGKLVVRMPKGLHRRAALVAEREGVSLNQFIVICIAEQVGTRARPVVMYTRIPVRTHQVGIAGHMTFMPFLALTKNPLASVTTGQNLVNSPIYICQEPAHA